MLTEPSPPVPRGEKPALGYARHGPTAALLVAYLLVSSAASVWLSPPEAAKAILALPALVIVPPLVGSALLRLAPIDRDVPGLDGFGRALIEWLVGSLALTALAVVLQLSGQTFLLQRFGLVALSLAVAGFLAGRLGIPRAALDGAQGDLSPGDTLSAGRAGPSCSSPSSVPAFSSGLTQFPCGGPLHCWSLSSASSSSPETFRLI